MVLRLGGLAVIHLSLVSNVCHSVCVCPAALTRGCVSDMLILVTGFISLVVEIKELHVCIWTMGTSIDVPYYKHIFV